MNRPTLNQPKFSFPRPPNPFRFFLTYLIVSLFVLPTPAHAQSQPTEGFDVSTPSGSQLSFYLAALGVSPVTCPQASLAVITDETGSPFEDYQCVVAPAGLDALELSEGLKLLPAFSRTTGWQGDDDVAYLVITFLDSYTLFVTTGDQRTYFFAGYHW